MALLLLARGMIALVPMRQWRGRLGLAGSAANLQRSTRLAAQVERAAWRLPLPTKCLPRAMALSWLLRRQRIGHQVTLAVRPLGQRETSDALHAWVEVNGKIVLGELPGPWIVIHRMPQRV
jgi:hypothetical protein